MTGYWIIYEQEKRVDFAMGKIRYKRQESGFYVISIHNHLNDNYSTPLQVVGSEEIAQNIVASIERCQQVVRAYLRSDRVGK